MSDQEKLALEQAKTRAELAQYYPWYFLRYVACTMDEHDPSTIAKPFPNKVMYRVICRAWQEFDILFMEKSRQILITWTMACLFLHDAMTKVARLIFFQSKKQEDANAILNRANHVYQQALPFEIPWIPQAKMTGAKVGTADTLEFPSRKSAIKAIPQGPDIVQSHTPSGIFADEMNLQPKFAAGYGAASPAIVGGGKYIAVGTANGHTAAWRILRGLDDRTGESIGDNLIDSDTVTEKRFVPPDNLDPEAKRRWIEKTLLDLSQEEFDAIPFHELVACVPGMRYWRTADGTDCLRVHYSADPDKSPDTAVGRAWQVVARAAMKSKSRWDREMEICYETSEGRPVIANFKRDVFVRKVKPDRNYPIILGADFGRNCCLYFAQAVPIEKFNVRQLRFLDEIFLEGASTPTLARMAYDRLTTQYRAWWEQGFFEAYCDPAGFQTKETTSEKGLNSSIGIMKAHGIRFRAKKFGVKDSTTFVEDVFATVLPNGEPAVIIDERCQYLIRVCDGGWHFPESPSPGQDGLPEKDGYYEHGGDALRYVINNVLNPKEVGYADGPPPTHRRVAIRQNGRIVGYRTIRLGVN